jgi:MoxR-like ATPase
MKIADVADRTQGIFACISEVIAGKVEVLERIVAGGLANGHILIEDYPGLAKTLIARLFAQATRLGFKRIQFTPDLLPSDVTGSFLWILRPELWISKVSTVQVVGALLARVPTPKAEADDA